MLTLPKGSLKVITIDHKATKENDERARNRGRIFIPPFVVYEWDEGAQLLVIEKCFGFTAKRLTPRYATGKFPYSWAPRALNVERAWFETTDEVVIQSETTEA